MAGLGFAFVAHGYLEPSRRVPGERERYLRSRRNTLRLNPARGCFQSREHRAALI